MQRIAQKSRCRAERTECYRAPNSWFGESAKQASDMQNGHRSAAGPHFLQHGQLATRVELLNKMRRSSSCKEQNGGERDTQAWQRHGRCLACSRRAVCLRILEDTLRQIGFIAFKLACTGVQHSQIMEKPTKVQQSNAGPNSAASQPTSWGDSPSSMHLFNRL